MLCETKLFIVSSFSEINHICSKIDCTQSSVNIREAIELHILNRELYVNYSKTVYTI